MRNSFKIFLFTASALIFSQNITAQKPAGKKNNGSVQKFKAPKLTITLGSFGDSSQVSVEQAENIISMPLNISDDRKTAYSISSYQFLYKRRVVTEDEQSGKVSPASSISSGRFKSTPLPELWLNTVREELKPGEELYFFDVIVKDPQGRIMYAPNIKILVK